MNVFLTGATGYIGSVVSERLRALGHQVTGLARSDAAAARLEAAGVLPVRGDLHDPASIARGARPCDAAIHTAMEYSPDTAALDRATVETILEEYRLTGRLFLYTSGIWVVGDTHGVEVDEEASLDPTPMVAWRPAHEQLVLQSKGARGVVVRPAMVYGRGGGVVGDFARQARENGVVRVVGNGDNHWPFVHIDDLANLYALALEAQAGSLYFAASGPSYPVGEVARAVAGDATVEFIPLEDARRQMGPLADALVLDQMISARKAIRELGWNVQAPSVLEQAS